MSEQREGHGHDDLSPQSDEDVGLVYLTETLDVCEPSAALKSRIMARLEGDERFAPHTDRVAARFGLSEMATREVLRQATRREDFKPGLWPGASLLITPTLAAVRALVARIPEGVEIPTHRHPTRELTYILDGTLIEDDGCLRESGTALDMPAGSQHSLRVVGGECLVVFALPPG